MTTLFIGYPHRPAERPCPEDRARTVREIFIKEQPQCLTLRYNPFATDEEFDRHWHKVTRGEKDMDKFLPSTEDTKWLAEVGAEVDKLQVNIKE